VVDVQAEPKVQAVMAPSVTCLYGPQGSLKSSIAATWPGPIRFYDLELGSNRIWKVEELVESKHLEIVEVILPQKSITTRHIQLDGFLAAWINLASLLSADFENPNIPTVVIDTGTMKWKLIQDGYLEEKQQAQLRAKMLPTDPRFRKNLIQIEFGEPNSRARAIMQGAKATKTNLILIDHETDEYAPLTMGGAPMLDPDGNPRSAITGRKLPDGFRATRDGCDWVIHTRVERTAEGIVPHAVIDKSAYGIGLVDMDFQWFNYQTLAKIVSVNRGQG